MNWIDARYGTWRGAVRLGLAAGADAFGAYRPFHAVDWRAVERLVFVCRGNICRSAIGQAKATALGLPNAGFGLRTSSGRASPPAAVAAAARAGFDLSGHRACAVEDFAFAPGDLLIGMEPEQGRVLAEKYGAPDRQVTLLGLWARPRRAHLHDPYSLGDAYFDTSFGVACEAVAAMAQAWKDTKARS